MLGNKLSDQALIGADGIVIATDNNRLAGSKLVIALQSNSLPLPTTGLQ
jgi:hypothetical protein